MPAQQQTEVKIEHRYHSIEEIANRLRELGLVPVDLAPAQRDADSITWASNTTLDENSDFYVANRADNTIVRMRQDGSVVAIRRVGIGGIPVNNFSLNGIGTSADGSKIYATFTAPGGEQGGLLELPAFGR